MKSFAALIALSVVMAPALAQKSPAPKPCEELKAEIARNIEAKGIKKYQLEIVAGAEANGSKKVVGTCERGSRKITYTKG